MDKSAINELIRARFAEDGFDEDMLVFLAHPDCRLLGFLYEDASIPVIRFSAVPVDEIWQTSILREEINVIRIETTGIPWRRPIY